MTGRRIVGASLALFVLAACAEEPALEAPISSGPRAVLEEEPSPLIVSPHVRRVPDDGRDAVPLRRPERGGGGGGGGDPLDAWRPRHAPPPSERDVAEFRERLEREMNERPAEPDDDACDRYFAVLRATADAAERPGRDMPEGPDRAELRQNCRALPEGFRNCLSPEYFRDHAEECEREMGEMAARGRRRRENAENELRRMRAGQQPWPGQAVRAPSAPRPIDRDDDREAEGG